MHDVTQGSEAEPSVGPSAPKCDSTPISQAFHELAELIGRKIAERWRVRSQIGIKELSDPEESVSDAGS